MRQLFARRRHSRPSPGTCPESDPHRAVGRIGRRARRRLLPEGDALDARLLLAAGQPALVAPTASPTLAARVEDALRPFFAQGDFPGISVAVVRHGKVALAGGYGLSNVATGGPVRADTRFDIGSVTKTFTALGVMLLYQQSQGTARPLNLDAPIGPYLSHDPTFHLPASWSRITTRELLAMTSGLRDVEGTQPWQAQLQSIAKAPLRFAPGTRTAYSNASYDLLGALIQQQTGQKFGTFVQDQILAPLGMTATQELGGAATVPDQAVGYGAPRHGRWPMAPRLSGSAMYAAAGMVSTARDMATYMAALLDGRLLSPATYATMWTPTTTPRFGIRPPTPAYRGLGWDTVIDTATGPVEVTKAGQVPGFTSELILDPSAHRGVFVAINTSHNGPDPSGAIADQVARAVYAAARAGSQAAG